MKKTYSLKVPVYISDSVEDEKKIIEFDGFELSQKLLIDTVISRIQQYEENPISISKRKRNKTGTQNIEKVNYEEISLGNDICLLLNVTSFSTNIFDGFVEKEKRIKLDRTDKLGSENHYFILYPHIFGVNKRQFKWIILLYEDPNKENSEIVSAVKLVLKEILDIKPVNIKMRELMEKLSSKGVISELSMKLVAVTFEDNEVDYEIDNYLTQTKITRIKEKKYRDVPAEEISSLIEDKSLGEYKRRAIRILQGKQELKLEQEYKDENKERMTELAEEIFNFTTEVSSEEIETGQIYKKDFIIKKLQPVLENYLSYTN